MRKTAAILLASLLCLSASAGTIDIPQLDNAYPRAAKTGSKLTNNRTDVDRWLSDKEGLAGRLQMYWDSHATEIYISSEQFDHAGGPAAPVPTVRYPAARRAEASLYNAPALEDIKPRQDSLGLWLINKKSGEFEWADPVNTGMLVETINTQVMGIAKDAALIYAKEGDERYAQLATEVLDTYLTGLYHRKMPVDLMHSMQQTLVGLTSFEVIHEGNIISYTTACFDLLHDYLAIHKADKMGIYEAAFKNWADLEIANGVPHNNWNMMQAQNILRIAVILQDDNAYEDHRGRRWYINEILNEDSIRQWSVGHMIENGFDTESGLWKECPAYSMMVLGDMAQFVKEIRNLIKVDIAESYPILKKSVYTAPQYTFPNGRIAAWGDGGYSLLSRKLLYPLEDDLSQYLTPVFSSPEVSWFVGRSGNDPQKSLMFSVSGSNGNHMHANGISLELYGKGYVQAPDMGRGTTYEAGDHRDFYSQFMAHNTVCVDGISTYQIMYSTHAYTLNASYPPADHKEFDSPVIFGDFSFIEPETMSDQRRQVILISDSDGGYYVDIFRSRRRDGKDKFHDYFYHNIGQEFELKTEMKPTEDLSFSGGYREGYSYFWDKYECPGDKDVKGTFSMLSTNAPTIGMNIWAKGSEGRRFFKALSPGARSLSAVPMPYNAAKSPVQTFVARQYGEAWDHPFVTVMEPFDSSENTFIESVEFYGKGYEGIKVKRSDGSVDIIEARPDGRLVIKVKGKTYKN